MPKIVQLVTVEVKNRGIEYGKRRYDLIVRAPANLFTLPDALAKEWAIESVELALRRAARKGVGDYILRAREFMQKVVLGNRNSKI